MNLLYLIDPNSIHDHNWIIRFTNNSANKCFFICREHHYNKEFIRRFEKKLNIEFVGTVDYFSFRKISRSLKQIAQIKRIIVENKIQLFHIQYAEPNVLWALFKKIFGVPIVTTCRGTDILKTIPSHFTKNDIFNKLIAWAYRRAFSNSDWITVTSQSQLDSLNSLVKVKENTSIIRTGVDLKRLKKDTSEFLPAEIKKPFFLFPRYIKPIYNHEFAIKALQALSTEMKRKYQMVFVGKNRGDLEYQNQLIQMLNDDKTINFLFLEKQAQEGIWELYKNAELVIMTPKSDGSPVSGMETIALNKKLILGPLNYDCDVFYQPNVHKLESWSTQELISLIEKLVKKDDDNIRSNSEYLNIIDRENNMQILNDIYIKVVSESKQ